MSSSVCIVTIATGRYVEFVPQLVSSARQWVVGLSEVFVLTDDYSLRDRVDAKVLVWGHTPWPFATLLRYRAMEAYSDTLSRSEVLLYVDADMRFVGTVDLRGAAGLTAVKHPGYEGADSTLLPFERDPDSCAFVSQDLGGEYYCGGVQGGRAEIYLEAVKTMADAIENDLQLGRIPTWHDESVWNWYLSAIPPADVLDSRYCTREEQQTGDTRIVALTKDHNRLRGIPQSRIRSLSEKLVRRLRRVHLWPM